MQFSLALALLFAAAAPALAAPGADADLVRRASPKCETSNGSPNAGDARAVLCRGGRAVRLTYDHKGIDKQEAKRIMDAGGFVMSGRVNGVLSVTRSLGDSSMKDFVVGAPYTTETELSEEDQFLIMACDGVSQLARVNDIMLTSFFSFWMSSLISWRWTSSWARSQKKATRNRVQTL